MLTITKEFIFHAAHMLPGHLGECKNLHGHTYKLQVTIKRILLCDKAEPYNSMVIDFSCLSEVIKNILEDIDHAAILNNNGDDFENKLISLLIGNKKKVVLLDGPTTVEKISEELFLKIDNTLNLSYKGLKVVSVKLWETPTSFAEYKGGE